MRVVIDRASNQILGTEATPDVGDSSVVNGKYVFPVPEGAAVTVDSATTLVSLTTQAAAELLVRYPMFSNIIYNPLIDVPDVAALDLTALGPGGIISRAMLGRAAGGFPFGISQNSTVILPQNNAVAPSRPGCLVSDTITAIPGADEAMLWWNIASFSTTEDVNHGTGATANINVPAYRTLTVVDQEPVGFAAYLSNDNGTTWAEATRLIPTDLSATGFGDTKATGTLTVNLSPATANITLGTQVLTAAAARISGSDNYNGTLGSTALIAADIAAAINDPNNSFQSTCTAAVTAPSVVTVTAVPLGTLGNAVAFSSSDGTVSASGVGFLAGGANADFKVAFTNTSTNRVYLMAYAILW